MIYGRNWEVPYLFIHVPKTAGTTLESHLEKHGKGFHCGDQHNVAFQARNWFPDFDSLYKFGFVRNPFAVELSIYAYHIPSWDGFHGKSGMSFDTWVKWRWLDTPSGILKTNPDMPRDNWTYGWLFNKSPMYGFFCDYYGKIIVDHIGRFERLYEEWGTIMDELKITEPIKGHDNPGYGYNKMSGYHHNYGSEKHEYYDYRQAYTTELVDIIAKAYSVDLEAFGYDFEDGIIRDSIKEMTDFRWHNLGEQYCYDETYIRDSTPELP